MAENSDQNTKNQFEKTPHWFGQRMALGYAMQYLYIGLYLPYFPLWLKARELTPFEISTVLSMALVIRVLASGQVMTLADKQKDRSTLLSWLLVGSAFSILLYIPSYGFWAILFVTLLLNIFFNPVSPLLDAITLSGVRRFDADYGKIRIWGSIVFILANMGGGAVLLGYDPEIILYALIASMMLGAALSYTIPRIGRKSPYENSAVSDAYRKSLLSNKRFLFVLAASGLGQASHALLYGFGSIYWQAIGMTGTMIGLFWAIGVIAEIVLFQFSKEILARVTSVNLIALGCIGGIIRWIIFPLIDSEAAYMALQILHGFSFGAVHIGMMHFIMESVPEDHIGAAQGVGYVLGGIVMGIAVFTSGPLYDAAGAYGFWAMAGLCALGLLLLLFKPASFIPKEIGTAEKS